MLGLVMAVGGAYTAARQSWLQWYPPEVVSCGRDLYGMIETFPLQRALPMIFRGGGDCTQIDWTFLGLSIANWSFIAFTVFGLAAAGPAASQCGSERQGVEGGIRRRQPALHALALQQAQRMRALPPD